VAIDMCTVFKAAVAQILPHATLAVDHFYLVQFANRAVTEVRRRVTLQQRGRGRDREWQLRNRLTWWPQIIAFIRTGITNAGSEGTNRGHQNRRPRRLRIPQPRKPTATHPLRHHPRPPRPPQPRLTSKSHNA
jgi:hypothetical protein